MPKAAWEKIGQEARDKAKQANAEFDALADKGLDGAKSSKYTGWILAGSVVTFILIIILVAELS